MRKFIAAVSLLALTVIAPITATSQEDVIKARQDFMKSNGAAMGVIGKMVKGEQTFDAATAMEALNQIHQNSEKFDAQAFFPAGSFEGDTAALPKIAEDMEGFTARAETWKKAAADAVAAQPQDVAALQVQMAAIGPACGGCHEAYRGKKPGS